MSSGKKTTRQKSTYTPPSWIESRAQQAASLASNYAAQPYTPYTGNRVAALTENERMGIDAAREGVGAYRPDLESARGALEGMTSFTEADIGSYMNPYIEQALNPAARELREDIERRTQDKRGRLASAGAFGSRAALDVAESERAGLESLSDLYSTGYARAFDNATSLWQADQDRAITQSRAFMDLAGVGSDLLGEDVNRLMRTGDVQRRVDQAMADFDYQQFVEGRDWGGRQASMLTDVLRGLKGSYTETTKSKTTQKEKGNALGQVLGAAATVAGAYFTGGGSLAGMGTLFGWGQTAGANTSALTEAADRGLEGYTLAGGLPG